MSALSRYLIVFLGLFLLPVSCDFITHEKGKEEQRLQELAKNTVTFTATSSLFGTLPPFQKCTWGDNEEKSALLCLVGYDVIDRISYQAVLKADSSNNKVLVSGEAVFPDGKKHFYTLSVSRTEDRGRTKATSHYDSRFALEPTLAYLDWDRWAWGERAKINGKTCQLSELTLHFASPFSGRSYDTGRDFEGFLQTRFHIQRLTPGMIFESIQVEGTKYCQNACYITKSQAIQCHTLMNEKKHSCEEKLLNAKMFPLISSQCEKFVLVLEEKSKDKF